MKVEDQIDRLYGLPLEEFTAARNTLAGELRNAGERDAADEVKALSKPSLSAWAVNQLARKERMQVRALLTGGERLRKAQEGLLRGGAPKELQEAFARQRDVIAALVQSAGDVLRSAGHPATEATLERVRATLGAAAANEEGSRLVESGRLTQDLDPAGFGPLVAGAPPTKGRADDSAARRKRIEQARREVERLRAEVKERSADARRAKAEATKAARAARTAEKDAEKKAQEVEELRGRLEAAQEALERER